MKVLHIAAMNTRSGVASYLMNYYRHIDREKFKFDFLSSSLLKDNYSEEVKRLGGNIFIMPGYKKHFFGYINSLSKIIKNNDYDIIHCHQFLVSIIPLFIARRNGIKVRIIHSHSSSILSSKKRLLVYAVRNIWFLFATNYFACSKEAALFLFGKKYKYRIINNAIDTGYYLFNKTVRNSIRNDLRLPENAFVIGYVARFVKEKNHVFLLNLFKNVMLKNNNAYLLLIGGGGGTGS